MAAKRKTKAQILATNESVRLLNGRKIDWTAPPRPNAMVLWLHQGKRYKGSFRTVCHMVRLNNLAKGKFGKEITVIQPDWNTGVAASAGTHDFDSAWDVYIPGVDWWVQQRFFRRNGFACWFRHPPLFGFHIHGFTLPEQEGQSRSDDWKVHGFKVGLYLDGGWSTRGAQVTSSQIEDYYNQAFGLSGQHTPNSDRSWHPADHKGGVRATIFDLHAFVQRRQRDQKRAAAA